METWQVLAIITVGILLIWFLLREYLKKIQQEKYISEVIPAKSLLPIYMYVQNSKLYNKLEVLRKAKYFVSNARNNKYEIPKYVKPHENSLFEDKLKSLSTLFNNKTFNYFPIDPVVKTIIDNINKENIIQTPLNVDKIEETAIFDSFLEKLEQDGWHLPKSNSNHSGHNTRSDSHSSTTHNSVDNINQDKTNFVSSDTSHSTESIGNVENSNSGGVNLEHQNVDVDLDHPTSDIVAGFDFVVAKIPKLDFDLLDTSINGVEIDIDIPGLTALRSIFREGRLVSEDKISLQEAARRVGLDVVGTGTGIAIGNIAGAVLMVEPITGLLLTAAAGIIGRIASDSYKKKPLTKAYDQYKDSYVKFESNRNLYVDDLLSKADSLLKEASVNYTKQTNILGRMPVFDEDNAFLTGVYFQLLNNYESDKKEILDKVSSLDNITLMWDKKLNFYKRIFLLSIDDEDLVDLKLKLSSLKKAMQEQDAEIARNSSMPLFDKIHFLLKLKYSNSNDINGNVQVINNSIDEKLKIYSLELEIWGKSYDNAFEEIIKSFRDTLQGNVQEFNVRYQGMIKTININKDSFLVQKIAFGLD